MAKLNSKELNAVLERVTEDFAALLKSEDASLSKADPGREAPAESTPEGSSSAPPAPEAGPPADASAPPMDASAGPPADASAPPPDASADPAGDAQADPAALQAEYSKLPVEDLKAHFLACKAALMAAMGGDGAQPPPDASPEASAPPPAPGPATSAPEQNSPPPPEMGKGEYDDKSGKMVAKSEKDLGDRLAKAEKAVAQVEQLSKAVAERDATIQSLEANIGKIAAGFQRILQGAAPMRKAVTRVSDAAFVPKPGDAPTQGVDVSGLSKAEVTQRLREVTAAPDLKKSDRDLVSAFYQGSVPVERVAHLLG